jgi:transposase-like protein
MELSIPRDRNGEFEPVLVPKHQRRTAGLDEKILALYARGLSTRVISAELEYAIANIRKLENRVKCYSSQKSSGE